MEAVTSADGLIPVTPVFSASYSGLFKAFFDVIDNDALTGKAVPAAATGGTARHSLALEPPGSRWPGLRDHAGGRDLRSGIDAPARCAAHPSCRADRFSRRPPRALREDPGVRLSEKATGIHLDPLAIITAFGLIFLTELPDKTMFASLAIGARMRPLYVWFGTSSAFIVHVAIAVGAGSLIGLLPDWIVKLISAGLFAFGAFMLLRGGGYEEEEDGGGKSVTGFWPVYTTAFMAVFISEWGDLTQITTANLAASNGTWSTAIGSAAALMSVSALALLGTTWLPLGTTAHKQGRIAEENALGGDHREQPGRPQGVLPRGHPDLHPGHRRHRLRLPVGAQLVGHLRSEISKRVDTYATALFHGMSVAGISDLGLPYTLPLGSPWDAVQLAAQTWEHEHRPWATA